LVDVDARIGQVNGLFNSCSQLAIAAVARLRRGQDRQLEQAKANA
jgi:hypothetical protein